MHTCGLCNTVLTLKTCYTGTVERFSEFIFKQSVLVRAVSELIKAVFSEENYIPQPQIESTSIFTKIHSVGPEVYGICACTFF